MNRALRRAAPFAAVTVGTSAAVATSHGVYEVVRACGVPAGVAALYPVITDGLALVGYASAVRLPDGHRRWAWTVVIAAAGLSGVGQATFLSGGLEQPPPWLRFGVGAWPAIAAALVAHLIFLMATSNPDDAVQPRPTAAGRAVQPPFNPAGTDVGETDQPPDQAGPATALIAAPASAPAKDRALAAAADLRQERDALPSVSELAEAAGVARGTAATALRELRQRDRGALRATTKNTEDTQ